MDEFIFKDPELDTITKNKQSGYNYRKRRQDDWTENYLLYRDRVITNRLTQRQSVNLPLMKIALKTLLKDVDDLPVLYFENLDSDKQAEIFKNEYWKLIGDENHNNFEIFDIIDKKQVFFAGRSFDQWQVIDGMPRLSNVDYQDILIDRNMNPIDIDSSRFLIHTHIFRPLSQLINEGIYDKEALRRLQMYYASQDGLLKSEENEEMWMEKQKRMAELGLIDAYDPVLGEKFVELSLDFMYRKEAGDTEEELYVYVEAEDQVILKKEKQEKIVGVASQNYWRKHYVYDSWADDVELQDFWSDGIADIVRTPNKVVNAWFSQMVENRTLRNLNMNLYDSTANENFQPQVWEAQAWGWYGVPGKPSEVYQKLEVADLSDSLDEVNFVIDMINRGSGATATQQGEQTEKQITLGEVQLALGEAKERIKGMSKFYTNVWKQRGNKFIKLLEAAGDQLDAVKIFKKGRNTDKIYSREISFKDWKSELGYQCKVWSQEERAEQNTKSIEKLNAVKANMPDNPIVDEDYKRKLLEFAEIAPDRINEAMDFEQQKREQIMMMQQQMGMGMPGMIQPAPTPQLAPGGQNNGR